MTDTEAVEPSSETWRALVDATAAAIKDAEQPDAAAEPAGDDQPDDDKSHSRREARYRTQLREAEAERDALRANVEAMQRAEVERIAAKSIQKPNALWSANVELADLLDDAGTVDPGKVDTAVKTARDTLGLAATRAAGYVAAEGQAVGKVSVGDPWKKAFRA